MLGATAAGKSAVSRHRARRRENKDQRLLQPQNTSQLSVTLPVVTCAFCALAVHFLFHSRLPLCGLHPQQQQQRPPAKWVSAALSSTGQQQEQSDQSSLIGGADGHASEPSHKPSSKASFNASLIGGILSPLTEQRRLRRQFAEIAFLFLPAFL